MDLFKSLLVDDLVDRIKDGETVKIGQNQYDKHSVRLMSRADLYTAISELVDAVELDDLEI